MEARITGPAGAKVELKQDFAKVQFADVEGTRFVGVGPTNLSIHTTAQPYLGWEEGFLPQIQDAVRAFDDLVTGAVVSRVGVRYVNRIAGVVDIREARRLVMTLTPAIDSLPGRAETFFTRVEYLYEDGIKLLMTTAKADIPEPALIIDIDVLKEAIEPPVNLDEALRLVNDLKSRLSVAFESVITDYARQGFDGD